MRAQELANAASVIARFIKLAADKTQGRSTFSFVQMVSLAAKANVSKTRHVSTKKKSKMRASVFEDAETVNAY